MSALQWDVSGNRFYENGVDRGVLYVSNGEGGYMNGVAWSGLISINESPSGAEPTSLWADNIKYLNLVSAEEFGGSIEAYQYPPEFEPCNGSVQFAKGAYASQQDRVPFGLCYRTNIGSDTKGNGAGYKLHIVYGCLASPTQMGYTTTNDNPEAMTMSWEFKSTPVNIANHKATSRIIIDSRDFVSESDKTKLKALEDILYGTDGTSGAGTSASLPTPATILQTLGSLG